MKILIVGASQGGLQTAHRLLHYGADVTLITARSTLEMRHGRAQMTQLTLPAVRRAEQELELDLWSGIAPTYRTVALTTVTADGTVGGFTGDLDDEGVAVDPRVKMADWTEYFEDKGGKVVIHGATVTDLEYFTRMFDAVLVAVGAGELGQLFATDPTRPLAAEAQVVSQAYVHDWPTAPGQDLEVYSAEAGVVYVIPTLISDGPAHSVMVAARPGGALDLSTDRAHRPDVHTLLPQRLEMVLPELAERYRETDLAEGSAASTLVRQVTPVVRTPVASLGEGFVVGMGDAVVTTEPRTGQGWAISTKGARHLTEQMITRFDQYGGFDQAFFTDTFSTFWQEEIRHTSAFSRMVNDFHTGRLSPTVLEAMARASTDAAYADQWVQGFNNPRVLTDLLRL
ncbi:styrene monooxygenase/indole monooxygenase family protein [Nocardiopsis alborubida]|uniref:FAD-binding protein n=1 Tax=Nocardiopsis alborubida TaxID=146802 RepID=A0A7X6M939_9ACTN|nr:styrene monooxygenase/indole monooxygenase family protein [Nocardiopsis alborubida]NKY96650.1 FAD-binding protein [Nocardiopsis alborubida]